MADETGLEVAIIGMAGRFPGAGDLDAFWANLRAGVESISVLSEAELAESGVPTDLVRDPRYVPARGVLTGADLFDAGYFGYFPRDAQILDPQQRVFLECALEALQNAGHHPRAGGPSIGVFAGASTNDYRALLGRDPTVLAAVDAFQLAFATEKDYLATRVSYKLGLEGPSGTVQTGCSTSLVATHLACQSLIAGECEIALAGGVAIAVPQRTGYLAVDGGVLSPDGLCRAFDAGARGAVGGEGVGVVVLRRLEDALLGGDAIRAVIRGSAINNDGARKIGFTAPSLEGQAMVVRAAQVAAGVDPETITYVEAHGTGTALGDPIEVAALTRAFRAGTARTGFCAIGSVKTNIGHLDVAAGVAGLIKTVLAMEHGELPPSLHFERPNPEIDFEGSPFFVNTSLRPWRPGAGRRRAGVSSFGIGGTNAHVVLEEAPPATAPAPSRRHQLVVLSARTPSVLARARANLATHLQAHPELSPADVAYTLQVGRGHFEHRLALLCETAAEAVAGLDGDAAERVLPEAPFVPGRPVVFLFPGGGSQHVDMARDLYDAEPVFREHVDGCADLLLPHLRFDLRSVLYPGEASAAAVHGAAAFPAAIFTVEYALAQLWMSWGVRPQAMIGHSLGEYVAACLAGVLSLEDALALIALRGQLFKELPPGAMLSVSLPPHELQPLLDLEVAIAAVNAPGNCVASGPSAAIDALESRLAGLGIDRRRVQVAFAAHSPAVDRISERFGRFLRTRRLSKPALPFVSNVTGTWATTEQVTDPNYWVTQLRETVRFSDGVRLLLRDPVRAFLEVGPGWTLSSLVRLHGNDGGTPFAISSLRHAQHDRSDAEFILTALGRLWLAGAEVDWSAYQALHRRRRVSLPPYPLERQRHWVGISLPPGEGGSGCGPYPADHRHGETPLSQTDVERRLATIWRLLFGVNQIRPGDSFFDLGGHSLLATRMLFQVSDAFGVALDMRALLRAPTLGQFAAAIERAREGAIAPEPGPDLAAEAQLDPVIAPLPAASRTRETTPTAVLLTGATGYLGASLLAELLHATDAAVHCLVRSEGVAEGSARIRQAMHYYGLWDERLRHRIVPVPGDLDRPRLGLSGEWFDALAEMIGAIYHCGARVHFTYPFESLKASNVAGTQEVLRLAAHGRLKTVHHVSTTAVFPPDGRAVGEDDELVHPEQLPTGYAQSKWVAEKVVAIARERGIPVSVYRPGAVTGDTRTGICRPDDAVWRMVKSCIQLGAAPEIDTDIVSAPVDYVSRAIVRIARQPDAVGRNFHLVADVPTRWSDVFDHVRTLGYRLGRLDYASWWAKVAAASEQEDNALLPIIHLFERDRPAAPQRFASQNTREALAGTGVSCSPLADHLGQYLARFVETGFLDPPPIHRSDERTTWMSEPKSAS